MKKILTGLMLLALSAAAQAQENGSSMDNSSFHTAMSRPNVVLIDLRPDEAFDGGHFQGAKHVDWESGQLLESLSGTDPDGLVLLYCGSGYRSGLAKEALIKAGYTNVHDLKGGMEALEGTGPSGSAQ